MSQKEKQFSEKELAIFHAVISLIEENVDVNSMKVSDITNRAGIGKGTAYEYFSSKEEMVIKAIIWAAGSETDKILEMLSGKNTMEEQILTVMDFIMTEMSDKKCNIQLLKIQGHSCEIKETLQKEFEKSELIQKSMEKVIDVIIEQGRRENRIACSMKRPYIYMTLISGFVSYFMYVTRNNRDKEVTAEEMKKFLCRNIMMNLENEFTM